MGEDSEETEQPLRHRSTSSLFFHIFSLCPILYTPVFSPFRTLKSSFPTYITLEKGKAVFNGAYQTWRATTENRAAANIEDDWI